MQKVEITTHFALIPWINRCEISPWLFLMHLRIGDGRRGSSNVLSCLLLQLSSFISQLLRRFEVLQSIDCDTKSYGFVLWLGPKQRQYAHVFLVLLWLGPKQTVSIWDSCFRVLAIPASAVLVLWLAPSQIQSAYVACRLAIGTLTESVCVCSLSCDWDPNRLSPSALLGLWLGPR